MTKQLNIITACVLIMTTLQAGGAIYGYYKYNQVSAQVAELLEDFSLPALPADKIEKVIETKEKVEKVQVEVEETKTKVEEKKSDLDKIKEALESLR